MFCHPRFREEEPGGLQQDQRAFGIGGPTVDTVLTNPNTRPGLMLEGLVQVVGGDHDVTIEHIATPVTDVYDQRLHGMTVGLRTELAVAKAVDKGDLDQVAVHPLPAQEKILKASAGWASGSPALISSEEPFTGYVSSSRSTRRSSSTRRRSTRVRSTRPS